MEAATGYSVIHEEKGLRKENSRGKFEVVVVYAHINADFGRDTAS